MQKITEAQYRQMGAMCKDGHDEAHIAARLELSTAAVKDFADGRTRNPIGMRVFEEMTRPPGITKEQHEAWLAQNGYRGFAEARP